MKTTIIFCFLLVAVAFAQHDRDDHDHHHDHERDHEHSKLVEDLLERGHQLLEMSHAVLRKHRSHEGQHLIQAIEREVILVEALMKDLATYHVDRESVMSEHHLHMIEEQLMYHEHRISEEIHILEKMDKDHRHEGHSVEELIRRGEYLVKHAREILERHRAHGREAEALKYEMEQVEHLIQALRRHEHGHSTEREEQQLARHERSMGQLIERIEHHHRNDDHDDRHHHDDHDDRHHHEDPHFNIMADPDHYEF